MKERLEKISFIVGTLCILLSVALIRGSDATLIKGNEQIFKPICAILTVAGFVCAALFSYLRLSKGIKALRGHKPKG
jgi:hypothetical protein